MIAFEKRIRFGAVLLLPLLLLLTAAAKKENTSSAPEEKSAAWRVLLDAGHTNGWEVCGTGGFTATNGALCAAAGGNGVLWYPGEKFGDCQIRVVFKLAGKDDNSGLFIRLPEPIKDGAQAVNQGYEVQIIGRHDEWHRAGCLYSLTRARTDEQPRFGEWNTLLVTLEGDRTTTDLNGRRIADYREGDLVPPKKESYEPDRHPRPQEGYIGLQIHGADTQTVLFKEVAVRPRP